MVVVLDSIMGSGKTSYIIQMINDNPNPKVVYITPYLDEVARIKESCPGFEEPESNPDTGELKLDSLNKLLWEGKNIASTHALFKLTNKETLDALQFQNYILVIDEVLEVISQEEFKKDDLPTVLKMGFAHVDEHTGFLIWDKENYSGAYDKMKQLCSTKSVVVVNNTALVWVFPARIFGYFKDIYVCTYMFDAQIMRYYFDMHSIRYEYLRVSRDSGEKYCLVPRREHKDDTSHIKINIYQGKKNDIGTMRQGKGKSPFYYLSDTWYKNATKEQLERMRLNLLGYFQNDMKSPSERNLWTVFKGNREALQGKGYTTGFLPCNARAVNSYRNKTCVAYVVNRFMRPMVIQFFKLHGITITDEQQVRYALSELLQFLFRSAIRDGKSISLYIPSVRMRHALQEWLRQPKAD